MVVALAVAQRENVWMVDGFRAFAGVICAACHDVAACAAVGSGAASVGYDTACLRVARRGLASPGSTASTVTPTGTTATGRGAAWWVRHDSAARGKHREAAA